MQSRGRKRPIGNRRLLRLPLTWVAFLAAGVIVLAVVLPVGAMQLENHDAFCGSCHTEGETTFLHRSTSTVPVDLASFHAVKAGTRCIDCHAGPGIVGRYVTLTYGASDLLSYWRGNYPQPAVQDTPIGDRYCTKCHADLYARQDFNNHFHVFLPRWQALDSGGAGHCVDCHASHDTLNDAGVAFLDRAATTRVCDRCHAFAGQG